MLSSDEPAEEEDWKKAFDKTSSRDNDTVLGYWKNAGEFLTPRLRPDEPILAAEASRHNIPSGIYSQSSLPVSVV